MQVKEIDINTRKIKGYGICNKTKKVQNLMFRWSYHSDLLYSLLSGLNNIQTLNTALFHLALEKEKLEILLFQAQSFIFFWINLLNTRDRKRRYLLVLCSKIVWTAGIPRLERVLMCLVEFGLSWVSGIWTSLDGELFQYTRPIAEKSIFRSTTSAVWASFCLCD